MSQERSREQLRALLERVFEDGVVEASEKDELRALYRNGGLTVADVREVFGAFVDKTWGEAMADGVIDAAERQKLGAIVRELKLPREALPEGVAAVLEPAP